MNSQIVAGPVPEDLDIRLVRRDTESLPSGALVRFQAISRGKNPRYNYRWLLFEDGRWFHARHSGDTSDWQTPFDTDLPAEPTAILSKKDIRDIKRQLERAGLADQDPYQADPRVEDGRYYVATARIDDAIYEIIYDATYPPIVEYLDGIVYEHEP